MTQLTLTIPNAQDAALIRKLLKKFEGVKVSSIRTKRKTGLDEALEDVAQGRVYQASGVEDLFNQLNAD